MVGIDFGDFSVEKIWGNGLAVFRFLTEDDVLAVDEPLDCEVDFFIFGVNKIDEISETEFLFHFFTSFHIYYITFSFVCQ